jgi:hypothetical protein
MKLAKNTLSKRTIRLFEKRANLLMDRILLIVCKVIHCLRERYVK